MKKNFFIAQGDQNGVNTVEEIQNFNNNNFTNNNYLDVNSGTDNTSLSFGRINSP